MVFARSAGSDVSIDWVHGRWHSSDPIFTTVIPLQTGRGHGPTSIIYSSFKHGTRLRGGPTIQDDNS